MLGEVNNMDERKDLLELLNAYIEHIIKNFVKKNPLELNEDLCTSLKQKLDLIVENNRELVNLDLSLIRDICPSFSDWEYVTLDYYQTVLRDTEIELEKEDHKIFKKILDELLLGVNSYEEKINNFKSSVQDELNKLVNPYRSIVTKLENNLKLNSNDIQLVYNIIKQSNSDISNSIKMMRYMFNLSLGNNVLDKENNISNLDEDEEIEIIDEVNLTYDVLYDLFDKYGIDFRKFAEEERMEIQKYGNLSSIESILVKFKEYGVNISKYFNTRSSALKNIFLYSNSELVVNLFENFIKYGIIKNENGTMDISVLLERPSRFLSRKKKWARRKASGGEINGVDNVFGCNEDVLKNLEYFTNEGLYVASSYLKSATYFDLPHEKILETVKTFELYGIDKKYYLQTLSCFASSHAADTIDMFTELGYLDYLKNNMSRLLCVPTSPMFYKLARAKQLEVVPQRYGKMLDGNVTYDNREYLGVNKTNGSKVTEQFIFKFDGSEYLDQIIDRNENNKTNVVYEVHRELINLLDSNFLVIEENGAPDYRLYNIGGVLLSRMKFLRIYNTLCINGISRSLDTLLYALTKNSIITEEELDVIYDNVSNVYSKLQEKRGVRKK